MKEIIVRKNLATVKQAMADKYARLAKSAKSKVKQRKFSNNADKYRQQAATLGSK